MLNLWRALFCALLVLTLFESTNCGRYSGRSSGGSRHSYPSSRGLSGSGSRQSSSLSGGHGYPSSHSSHGYPSSGGMSGSGNAGKASYPSSGSGLSGSGNTGKASYPSSGSGLSGGGTQSHSYPSSRGTAGNTHHTTVNHNYHYSPPQQIRYSGPGQTAHSYPVYQGQPPTYVYQYKNSDSKYGTLLAGLALLNLGTLGASVYAASKAGSGSGSGSGGGTYKAQPGEYCKFGIKKDNGDYEETRIDCNLITSFIFQEEAKTPQQTGGTNTVVTTTVTNVTVVNATNGQDAAQTTTQAPVLFQQLPNGTLVPVNITLPNTAANTTSNGTAPNGVVTMTSTTTTTNTTVTNALDVKGEAVKVTPGMQCFVIRHTSTNNMRKTVPCGLLQSYADQSIKKNSAARNIPTFSVLCAIMAFVFY